MSHHYLIQIQVAVLELGALHLGLRVVVGLQLSWATYNVIGQYCVLFSDWPIPEDGDDGSVTNLSGLTLEMAGLNTLAFLLSFTSPLYRSRNLKTLTD